ncbi:MAG: transposase, partial [Nostoc sp.]
DHGYHPEFLREELEKVYPQIMTKIRFELSAKPSKLELKGQGKSGFVPVAARWVIERSNAWMERCKILVKNFERTLEDSDCQG